ncbi:YybH family protein [Taklimakanibacter deserti]|uniref:YybH family protein n=1 Tax=Taklimakanibacter deserti TaxID=2267839 RepID=UPI000E64751D
MTSKAFYRLTCLAFVMLGTPSIYAQSPDNQESPTMEHDQIQSTIDRNNSAVAARDIEGILATYEPDAVVVGQPGKPAMGTPALREAFKQFLALDPKLDVARHEVIQAGDIALHSYTWKMSGKVPGGAPIEQSGLSVVVLRKQPDGRWLMVIDNPFGDHLLPKN